MQGFMTGDFLLETETARTLYRSAAENAPIFDYHCHLPPAEIAENRRFASLAEAWLAGDHYKWRVMRAMGIDEALITGDAPPYEKFLAWAETVENLIGNPLYHWTHLELQRCFNIPEPLTEKSAPAIWERANSLLQTPALSVKGIFERFNVYAAGTTDDPADSLEYHRAIAEGTAPIGRINTRVIPSFRPDRALDIEKPDFPAYIGMLGAAAGAVIQTAAGVVKALEQRLDFFASLGCRASDHALESMPFAVVPEVQLEQTFQDALAGKPVPPEAAEAWKTGLLCALAPMYAKRGMVMQIHLSALRSVNERMGKRLGPDTGFDAAGDREQAAKTAALFSRIESGSGGAGLPKTIVFSLNPKDYYPLATVIGGFQGGCRGKMQLGPAWWFCDSRDGIEEQLRVSANLGVLPVFAGMLTDSRSFLSYPRHEYFRRLLCNLLGKWVENGEYPNDAAKLREIVQRVSFTNAKEYFESKH